MINFILKARKNKNSLKLLITAKEELPNIASVVSKALKNKVEEILRGSIWASKYSKIHFN